MAHPIRTLRMSTAASMLLVAAMPSRGASPVLAAAPPLVVTTEAVYAAFVINLTRFVSWPASAFRTGDSPLVIGTFPRDALNAELDNAAVGEAVNGHPLQTIRIQSLNDLAKCQVVFISRTNNRQAAILAHCAGKPILLIGDGDGLLEAGGHVRFVSQPPHTRLRISVENLRASGLECRAQLLRAAATP
jgi:hypothetical protein